MGFPQAYGAKLHRTNPTMRLNGETTHFTDVIGTFSNESAIIRLADAILFLRNDSYAV